MPQIKLKYLYFFDLMQVFDRYHALIPKWCETNTL